MAIDKLKFYKGLREQGFVGKLSQNQVNSIDYILNYWDQKGYKDLRWLAYMFATIHHETAATYLPIEEYGKGKGRPYGKKLKRSGVAYINPNKIYYGRGYVQLTWFENYELMGGIQKEKTRIVSYTGAGIKRTLPLVKELRYVAKHNNIYTIGHERNV